MGLLNHPQRGRPELKTNPISRPHEKTRKAHKLETTEDYLEAIAETIEAKAVCRCADLAKRFAVSAVTVHKIVERLRSQSLVTGQPYEPIELTTEGKSIAAKSKERHQRVFDFLILIGVDVAKAEIASEGMEYHVSPKTLEQFKARTRRLAAG